MKNKCPYRYVKVADKGVYDTKKGNWHIVEKELCLLLYNENEYKGVVIQMANELKEVLKDE